MRVLGEKVLERGMLSHPSSLAPHPKPLDVGSFQVWAALVKHWFLWSTESPAGSSSPWVSPHPPIPGTGTSADAQPDGKQHHPHWCQGWSQQKPWHGRTFSRVSYAGCWPSSEVLICVMVCPAERPGSFFPGIALFIWVWGWRWGDFLLLLCPPWPGTWNCSFITCDVAVSGYKLSAPSASSRVRSHS